ncbi:MAG: 50S ribosomal protein L15 [Candidatus Hydrogenedens sp.]|nr:50S ribosomal protein L15 [Candidatus Hydrogenedens sp.]
MELHELTNSPGAVKNRKRVGRGRGSGTGKTAGKGHKGQKARVGYNARRGFEGGQTPLHRRLPKRGFNHQKRRPLAIINVDLLEKHFAAGTEITIDTLREMHLVPRREHGVKVLAKGEITKALTLKVQAISPSAQSKVEAAGGTVEIVAFGGDAAPEQAEAAAPAQAEEE